MFWCLAYGLCMRVVRCSVLALHHAKHTGLSPASNTLGLVCNSDASNKTQECLKAYMLFAKGFWALANPRMSVCLYVKASVALTYSEA